MKGVIVLYYLPENDGGESVSTCRRNAEGHLIVGFEETLTSN